jgi:pimeloyl-ACP methyl ester carboxylesterase
MEVDQAPEWFTKALATAPEGRRVDVDGTAISYLAWGDRSARGLVLVHGGGAHAHWWDHIAPLLALDRRVVALDLSGHGDSGRRDTYTLGAWAAEVLAVAADAGLTEPPTVIGHSMGGLVTLRLASLQGARLAGAVVIDAPVRDRDLTPEELAARDSGPSRPRRRCRTPPPTSPPPRSVPRPVPPAAKAAKAAGPGSSIPGSSAASRSAPP